MSTPYERSPISETPKRREGHHPKRELYTGAYDLLTQEWFKTVFTPENLQRLEDHTEGMNTVEMLECYNEFFHEGVDYVFDADDLQEQIAKAVEIVSLYKEHVLWVGYFEPAADASLPEVAASLRYKFKRNISLALLEALALLESGILRILKDPTVPRKVDLAKSMRYSHALYMRLARIHETHARQRWQVLTDADEIAYPDVGISEIVEEGRNIINSKYLKLAPLMPEVFQVDFIGTPTQWRHEAQTDKKSYPVPIDTPTMVCPAERLRPTEETQPQLTPYVENTREKDNAWNGYFWELLIRVYERSGRFDEYIRNAS